MKTWHNFHSFTNEKLSGTLLIGKKTDNKKMKNWIKKIGVCQEKKNDNVNCTKFSFEFVEFVFGEVLGAETITIEKMTKPHKNSPPRWRGFKSKHQIQRHLTFDALLVIFCRHKEKITIELLSPTLYKKMAATTFFVDRHYSQYLETKD